MTRPSRNQDQLLIETARKLLPEVGISGMSLKRIADECGVNIGMFHYHFKTKSAFVRKVLECVNQDIKTEFEAAAREGKTSIQRLHSAVLAVGLRMLKEKKIVASMIRDFLNGDPDVIDFVVYKHAERLKTIGPLIEECRKDGYLEPLPFAQIVSFIQCSVTFPTLLSEILDRCPSDQLKMPKRVKDEIASEAAVRQRIDLAFKAICKKGAPIP